MLGHQLTQLGRQSAEAVERGAGRRMSQIYNSNYVVKTQQTLISLCLGHVPEVLFHHGHHKCQSMLLIRDLRTHFRFKCSASLLGRLEVLCNCFKARIGVAWRSCNVAAEPEPSRPGSCTFA